MLMKKFVMVALASFVMADANAYNLVITLSNQTFALYDHGQEIRSGRVSAASAGRKNFRGMFHVVYKVKDAWSDKYNAPMPYSLFFYKNKAAVHVGVVPRNPIGTSHGCVHVVRRDGVFLYSVMQVGDPITIQ
jgi:lipoprotein-anchoring transpeptidase ErfK/SrfK